MWSTQQVMSLDSALNKQVVYITHDYGNCMCLMISQPSVIKSVEWSVEMAISFINITAKTSIYYEEYRFNGELKPAAIHH